VEQGGGVDELHGGCQRQLRRAGVAECVGKQQYKSGADPLATGADDVLADLIDERHIGCEPIRQSFRRHVRGHKNRWQATCATPRFLRAFGFCRRHVAVRGEKIKVEQIAADVGQEIVIDQVLAVGNGAELKVGTPLVSGATVKATVVAQGRHDKVRIFKMRRRKHYQKRQGHRQQFTELQIGGDGLSARSFDP
jgi:large subunit ribosomal protein L21